LKKSLKKFGSLNLMPTFAIPKSKQPLTLGEKERDVATKIN
jgi:hypothetical protein